MFFIFTPTWGNWLLSFNCMGWNHQLVMLVLSIPTDCPSPVLSPLMGQALSSQGRPYAWYFVSHLGEKHVELLRHAPANGWRQKFPELRRASFKGTYILRSVYVLKRGCIAPEGYAANTPKISGWMNKAVSTKLGLACLKEVRCNNSYISILRWFTFSWSKCCAIKLP